MDQELKLTHLKPTRQPGSATIRRAFMQEKQLNLSENNKRRDILTWTIPTPLNPGLRQCWKPRALQPRELWKSVA